MSSEMDPAVLAAVSERLVQYRVRAGFALEDAAGAADISVDDLAAAEAGTLLPPAAQIERLCEVYRIDPEQIFGGRVSELQDYA